MPLDLEQLNRDLSNLTRRFDIFEARQQMLDKRTEEWRDEARQQLRELRETQRQRANSNGHSNGKGSTNTVVVAVATAAAAAVVAAYKFLGGP